MVCSLRSKEGKCFVSIWCAVYEESRIVLSVGGVQFMKKAEFFGQYVVCSL